MCARRDRPLMLIGSKQHRRAMPIRYTRAPRCHQTREHGARRDDDEYSMWQHRGKKRKVTTTIISASGDPSFCVVLCMSESSRTGQGHGGM